MIAVAGTKRGQALMMGWLASAFFVCPVDAMDADGLYAVDGAGRTTCEQFTAARSENGDQLRVYAGWVDGYVSGLNHRLPETYDLTPWQSVELLIAKLGAFCAQNPDTQFAAATNQLVQTLYDMRLTAESQISRVQVGGSAVFLYQAMIPRIHAALQERGFDAGPETESYSERLAAAVRRFQIDAGLSVNGLPDQLTLNALFP